MLGVNPKRILCVCDKSVTRCGYSKSADIVGLDVVGNGLRAVSNNIAVDVLSLPINASYRVAAENIDINYASCLVRSDRRYWT